MKETDTNSLEGLARLVSERGAVTPKEAADALNIEEKGVLDLTKILESQSIVKTRYTVTGDITIEKGDKMADASKDELDREIKQTLDKQAEKEREKDTTAAEIIEELRERIRDKRHEGGSQ